MTWLKCAKALLHAQYCQQRCVPKRKWKGREGERERKGGGKGGDRSINSIVVRARACLVQVSDKHTLMQRGSLCSYLVQAPATFSVDYETTAGTFTVDVTREWAPPFADRFYALSVLEYHRGASASDLLKRPSTSVIRPYPCGRQYSCPCPRCGGWTALCQRCADVRSTMTLPCASFTESTVLTAQRPLWCSLGTAVPLLWTHAGTPK